MNIDKAIADAALGDWQAQIALTETAVGMSANGLGDPLICLVEACVFARLAYSHGDNLDRGRLVSVLSMLGDVLARQGKAGNSDMVLGEAIAHLDAMADDGEDMANNSVMLVANSATPRQLEVAKSFRSVWGKDHQADESQFGPVEAL